MANNNAAIDPASHPTVCPMINIEVRLLPAPIPRRVPARAAGASTAAGPWISASCGDRGITKRRGWRGLERSTIDSCRSRDSVGGRRAKRSKRASASTDPEAGLLETGIELVGDRRPQLGADVSEGVDLDGSELV